MPAFDGSPSWDDPVDYLGRAPRWEDRAACKNREIALWWPSDGEKGKQMSRQAKAVCATCDVISECLNDVMSQHPDPGGVWGGTTKTDRKNLRRQRRRAA